MSDEFFIGWLAMPRSLTRFLRILVGILLATAVGIATTLPTLQKSAGEGDWQVDSTIELVGTASADPYAMIRVADESTGELTRTVMVVSSGKFGAQSRLTPFAGQRVRLRGTMLHRNERWMLELVDGEDAIQSLSSSPARSNTPAVTRRAERATLRGEIIDPKCYLGAMKPGGGKTHKACATLCIAGGIPPMLVTRDAGGRETFYLLLDSQGHAIADSVLPYVGDLVAVTGDVECWDDLFVLRLHPNGVRRL